MSAYYCRKGPNPSAGFDALFSRMKQGKRVTAQLLYLFKERASMEEEYGKRLAKLAKVFQTGDEIGTLRESLNVVKTELETSARAHLAIANEIRVQLEHPTAEFMAAQSGTRKNHHAIIDQHLKSKSILETSANKVRDRYVARCKEVNELMHQKPGLPPKDMEKIQQKIHRAQYYASHYDVEYLTLVERHNDVYNKWTNDFNVTCRECQKLEQERFNFTQTKLWSYANILSGICIANDESHERLRLSLELCDSASDIATFLSIAATGSIPPPPLQYLNFHTGTSLRPLNALLPPKPRRDSGTSLRINSIREYRPPGIAAPPLVEAGMETKGSMGRWAADLLGALFGAGKEEEKENGEGVAANGVCPNPFVAVDEFRDGSVLDGNEDVIEYDPFDVPEETEVLFRARVLFPYAAQAFEELTIARGQEIPVIAEQDDGWLEGIVEATDGRLRRGLFPGNFAEAMRHERE